MARLDSDRDEGPESPPELGAVQAEVFKVCAQAARQLGLPPSVGRVFGAVFCCPRPLTRAEIAARLRMSAGSVSQSLRQLRKLGVVRPVRDGADRRVRFVAQAELRQVVASLFETQVRAPMLARAGRLRALKQALADSRHPDRAFLAARAGSLEAWHRMTLFLLPQIGLRNGPAGARS